MFSCCYFVVSPIIQSRYLLFPVIRESTTISGVSYGCISRMACSTLSYSSLRVLAVHSHSWAVSIFSCHQYVLVIGPETCTHAASRLETRDSAIFCAPSFESTVVIIWINSAIIFLPFRLFGKLVTHQLALRSRA